MVKKEGPRLCDPAIWLEGEFTQPSLGVQYSHVCLLRWQNAKLTNGLHRTRGHVHKSRAAAARAAAQKSTALSAAGGATGGVNGGGGENFAFQVQHMSHFKVISNART